MVTIFTASTSLVILLCSFIGVLLLRSAQKGNNYNWLLATFFLMLSYYCLIAVLISTGIIRTVPHFYRTGNIAFLLCMPASYLYVRSVITNRPLTKIDLINLLPALVYFIDYIPFFLLSGDDKMRFFASPELNRSVIMFGESTIFPPGFYIVLRYVLALVYWLLQCRLLWHILRVKESALLLKENAVWLRWLAVFILSEAFLFLYPLAILNRQWQENTLVMFATIGGFTGLMSVFVFFFPQILYGIRGMVIVIEPQATEEAGLLSIEKNTTSSAVTSQNDLSEKNHNIEPFSEKEKRDDGISSDHSAIFLKRSDQPKLYQYISEARMNEIASAINKHFEEVKPYLQLHYTLQQLSSDLELPSQYISSVINRQENMNFNDFVNKYRVQYCIKLLENDEHHLQTLEAVAKQSGFNNRNTFTIAFKKFTGNTPSHFIKELS